MFLFQAILWSLTHAVSGANVESVRWTGKCTPGMGVSVGVQVP